MRMRYDFKDRVHTLDALMVLASRVEQDIRVFYLFRQERKTALVLLALGLLVGWVAITIEPRNLVVELWAVAMGVFAICVGVHAYRGCKRWERVTKADYDELVWCWRVTRHLERVRSRHTGEKKPATEAAGFV
jgi:hypothetical protein